MDTPPTPSSIDRRHAVRDKRFLPLLLAGGLALGGCTTGGGGDIVTIGPDGRPTEAALQRIANSALASGVANVHFVDGVAYVTGNVKTAIDANAVVRALRQVEGVDRVESLIRRGM